MTTTAPAATDPVAAMGGGTGVPVGDSDRFRLAQLAHTVALGTVGVLATDPGPEGRFATVDRGRRLEGVTCVATGPAGYEVALALVCGLVPLRGLGASIREAVSAAAAAAALPLDRVDVRVTGVVDRRYDAPAAAGDPVLAANA